MDYIVYLNAEAAKNNDVSTIKIPFFKCTPACFLDIMRVIRDLELPDYRFEIGPYPSPLTWVSYMESTFQFCLYFQH